jgi:hypothetical protein
MPVTPVLASLPALSTASPATDWLAPSVERITEPSPVQDWMPDGTVPASAQVKFTVTSALFQPFGFAALRLALIVGAVLSSFTVTELVAMLFALSVAVPPTSVPFVSVLMVLDAVVPPSATQLLRPEPPSLSAQVKVTVASALFQPAALGAGVTLWLIVGAVVSLRVAVCDAVAVLPATSVAVPVTTVPAGTVLLLDAGLVPSATQLAMPDAPPPPEFESLQVKVTVIVPSAFSICAAVMVGLALSTRTVTDPAAPVLPGGRTALERSK